MARSTGGDSFSLTARTRFGILVVHAVGTISRFGMEVAFARASSPRTYGAFTFAFNLAQLLAPIAALGLPASLVRFIPEYLASGRPGLARGLIKRSQILTLISATALGLLAYGAAPFIDLDATPALVAILIIVVAQWNLHSQLGRSLNMAYRTDRVALLVQPTVAILAIGLWFWFSGHTGPSGLIVVTVLSFLVAIAGIHAVIRSNPLWMSIHQAPSAFEQAAWLRVGFSLMTVGFSSIALSRLDVVLVGLLTDGTEIALYGAATKTGRLALLSQVAINSLTIPVISRLFWSGDRHELQGLVSTTARWVSAISLALFASLLLLGRPILATFGPSFVEAYPALLIVSGAQLINSLTGPVAYLLNVSGNERLTVQTLLAALLANITLNVTLIPLAGIEGAAIASAITIVILNVFLYIAARNRTGIRCGAWVTSRHPDDPLPSA